MNLKRKYSSRNALPSISWVKAGEWLMLHVPGVMVVTGIALLVTLLQPIIFRAIPLGLLTIAVLLGILLKNTVGVDPILRPGIHFSLRRILKLSVILLGLQFSITQVVTASLSSMVVLGFIVILTMVFTIRLGLRLGVNWKLANLISAGTAICGASAIIAANTTIDSSDEEVAYAISLVTLYGTVAMLIYPLLAPLLSLTPHMFGIWCGTSIHEVAQVIAASFQYSPLSGELATVTKLTRVAFLVPMVLVISFCSRHRLRGDPDRDSTTPTFPWFILFFIGLSLLSSLVSLTPDFLLRVNQLTQFLLVVSLVAVGLEVNLLSLKKIGFKPFYLGAASWLFISTLSLFLIKMKSIPVFNQLLEF